MKKCKECGRDEWGFLSVLNEDGYCPTCAIAHYGEKIKKLQEQLADANKTIDYYDKKDFHYKLADGTVMGAEPAHKYKLKWGVK